MINLLKQKNKNNSGFTLVETLVAISIFTISILALMSVLSKGMADTNYAKQKNTASYLAQEGIEYIRNMRDTSVLSNQDGWTSFINNISLCTIASSCYVDMDLPNTFISCPGNVCPFLEYDSSFSKYGYNLSSNVDSGFTRIIYIDNANLQNNNNEIKIISRVEWTQGSGNRSVEFSENLYNWIE